MDELESAKADSREMRRVVGPYARAILVTTPQGNYAVAVEDSYVGKQLRYRGSYSANELELLKTHCNSSTRLLVVGANIGALAIPLARGCASTVAIEANPQTFELLNLNVALNGVANFRGINKAAGNRWETIEFLMSRTNPGGSKRKPAVHQAEYVFDNPEVAKVEAAPLDELLAQETFDVVIMDIEGSEYFALQGMQRILASAGVLQMEFLPHHLRNVAGVSVAEFLALIAPHFLSMAIPTRGMLVGREQFGPVLTKMFEQEESDSGLIFLKSPPQRDPSI